MALPYDATFKQLVRRHSAAFLKAFHVLAGAQFQLLDADLSQVSSAADLLIYFPRPRKVVVHLEFQTATSRHFPRRLFRYNAQVSELKRCDTHTVVVLLHRGADHRLLTGRFRRKTFGGRGRVDFRYEVIRLWETPMAEWLRGEVGALPLAVLGGAGDQPVEAALERTVAAIAARVTQELPESEARDLMTAAYVLTGLRVNQAMAQHIFRGVKTMRESKTYMAILEEGKQAGLAEGLEIGRQEGLQTGMERGRMEGLNEGAQRGRVEALQEMLLQLGTEQWGAPDAESAQRIAQMADMARLQRLIARCHKANSWSELLSPVNGH